MWGALVLAGGCAAPSPPTDPPNLTETPPGPQVRVEPVWPASMGRSIVEAFAPTVPEDAEFERRIEEEVRAAHRAGLGDRAIETLTSLTRLRRQLVDRGLPDVYIGVPYAESRLHTDVTSPYCAAGPWQILPEVAVSRGLKVEGCAIDGLADLWSPAAKLPPPSGRVYLGGGCRMTSCLIDERRDLRRSTQAAIGMLEEARGDERLSGRASVPLALVSFHGGLGAGYEAAGRRPDDAVTRLSACAHRGCDGLSADSAGYAQRVMGTAAVVLCAAARPDQPVLADFARSRMCGALYADGWGPKPATAVDIVAHRARKGWVVGLAALDVAGFGMVADRHRVEQVLVDALVAVPGVKVLPGVPGEDAELLREAGADTVLHGELGRRGDRLWLRLAADSGAPVLDVLELATFDESHAIERIADLVASPIAEHRDQTLVDLIAARRDELAACAEGLPDEGVDLRVDVLDPGVAKVHSADDCVRGAVESMEFPPELTGASARAWLSKVPPKGRQTDGAGARPPQSRVP